MPTNGYCRGVKPSLIEHPAPQEAPLPERFFALLQQWGVEISGQRAVVLGSIHGRLAASLARRGACGFTVVPHGKAPAFERTHFPQVVGDHKQAPIRPRSLDLLFSRGCAPSPETFSALAPGGWCVLVDLNWIAAASKAAQNAERCLETLGLRPSQEHEHGLHPDWIEVLQQAGMEGLVSASSDVEVAFDRKGWQAEVLSEGKRRGVRTRSAIEELKSCIDSELDRSFQIEPSDVLFRMFAVAGRLPRLR